MVESETTKRNVQAVSEGAGPAYHRRYEIDLPVPFEDAVKTMETLMADPNLFSPQLIARFEKTKGAKHVLRVGDEFMVHLTAPWQAPVRVCEVTGTSFKLLTLDGHIEAGQIEFRLTRGAGGRAHFVIESVSRSKDRVVNFFYDTVRVAQFVQTEMWQLFCEAFAEKALEQCRRPPEEAPPVQITTLRQNQQTGKWDDVSDQIGADTLT